tara:strand:- start:615 stop:731 length:117 start_codon:yes stop_codon:yes gene_type:complete
MTMALPQTIRLVTVVQPKLQLLITSSATNGAKVEMNTV